MKATRLSFVRVAKGVAPSPASLRPGVEEVSDFLCAHAAGLIAKAADGSAANATFHNAGRQQLIEELRTGADEAFLAAADILAHELTEQINHVGNAAPGLLVCTTIEDGPAPYAAVLKLEVVSNEGAVLRRLESGEETLAAVTNVLDRPGDLQKGLVFPDARPDSDAVVGDKAAQQEARYFLRSVGVTLQARPSASAAALVAAVGKRMSRAVAQEVVVRLPSLSAGSPTEVLGQLQEVGVDIPAMVMEAVATDLATADRPVPVIAVEAPVKGKVRVGGLTITGSASDIRSVTWVADPAGGWVVTIRTDTEPVQFWS